MKTIQNKLIENVTPAPVGSGDLFGSVVRGRAEWLDLLHKCQNGEATCLYVLKEMEAEIERENSKLREALQGLVDWGKTLPDIASDRQREQYEADYARAVAALPNNPAQTREPLTPESTK